MYLNGEDTSSERLTTSIFQPKKKNINEFVDGLEEHLDDLPPSVQLQHNFGQ